MQECIYVVNDLSIGIYMGQSRSANPLITGSQLSSRYRNFSRDLHSGRMARGRTQGIPQSSIDSPRWRQRSGKCIDCGHLQVVADSFAQGHARTPGNGRTAVIGKCVGVKILKVLCRRQFRAPAKESDVATVIVEGSHLKEAVAAEFSPDRQFLMPAIFKNGSSLVPQQSREGIQLVQG